MVVEEGEAVVTYEVAVKLRHLGFNDKCPAYYFEGKEVELIKALVFNNEGINYVAAPTKEQAFQWLLKNLWIKINKK